jgi:hypothetical protein
MGGRRESVKPKFGIESNLRGEQKKRDTSGVPPIPETPKGSLFLGALGVLFVPIPKPAQPDLQRVSTQIGHGAPLQQGQPLEIVHEPLMEPQMKALVQPSGVRLRIGGRFSPGPFGRGSLCLCHDPLNLPPLVLDSWFQDVAQFRRIIRPTRCGSDVSASYVGNDALRRRFGGLRSAVVGLAGSRTWSSLGIQIGFSKP